MRQADIVIKGASVMMPDMKVKENLSIAIADGEILAVAPYEEIEQSYTATETIDGHGKMAVPGMVDAHTHTCQQLLRGRVTDEYPMVWTRFLVPFESNLTPEDVYWSSQLACLEMIKSGTTAFADSGGLHMEQVVQSVLESGMRAAIARSTMDMGAAMPESMVDTTEAAMQKTEDMYRQYHGAGDGRVDIWFAMRQVMCCSPELVRQTAARAKELGTGVHAHLCEHKDEVSFCLQKYQMRPAQYLLENGMLSDNLLTAHNVVLSEGDLEIMAQQGVKVIHCPRANLTNHGFPKTPRMLEMGLSIGLGSDGAAPSSLSLLDEMKVFRSGIIAYWGLPIFDPVVLPIHEIARMATQGGANALLKGDTLGSIEVGKKADIITVDIDQPHLSPSYDYTSTFVESVNSGDVKDSIINGKLVMKDREVLTMDEKKIMAEARVRFSQIAERAGISPKF